MSTSNGGSGPTYGHAVVVGGSLAGLTAARALADHFNQVTLIERDALPDAAEARKGVPQANHVHALLKRGQDILSSLFPDLERQMVEDGAVPVDTADTAWWHFGGWKAKTRQPLVAMCSSRPFLEQHVRRGVRSHPKIKIVEGEVSGLALDKGRNAVTGVTYRRGGTEETLAADLVVEAGGRGTRLPAWLEAAGRSKVKESVVKVDVGYSTRTFKRPPDSTHPAWKIMIIVGQSPESRRIAFLAPVEGGRWVATLAGILGDHPPTDAAGWLEFARGLPVPDYYNAVKDAEPLTDPLQYKFPANLRRHWEQMADFPEGLAVVGDAHCSFNPIYAQGMTLSAVSAEVLQQHLGSARRSSPERLPQGFSRGFQRALAAISNDAWAMTTGEDFRYPEVTGDRPFGLGAIQWYTKRFQKLVQADPSAAEAFFRVAHMIAPVSDLMKPGMVFKVLKGAPESGKAGSSARPGA